MAKRRLKKGLFIVFDGPDGSGKSTHSRMAAGFLRKSGYDVLYTREPGGTKLGDEIRKILLKSAKSDMPPLTELLLFEVSRYAHVREVILPALKKKKIVISDRFNIATFAYQGHAGGIPFGYIKKIESLSLSGVEPDLTVILDVAAELGLARINPRRKDRIESKKLSFHRRVRDGYLAMAGKNRKKIKVIETGDSVKETFEDVKREVMNVVRRYKRPG